MNEQLKKYIDPVRNFFGKLTKRTKVILCAVLGGIVALAVILGLLMNRTQYTVLYAGLASDEAQQVTTELKNMNVDFKDDNGTIYVDSSKENSVRMQLSNEGYPKTAPNYNFFTDHVGVMTTDEERKIIQQYQLQERLGAVIKTMDPVDTAYVTISLPEGGSYAWDDNKQAASASVSVKLRPGKTMQSTQVAGIKQLVSKSVPNLSAENVAVVDSSSGEELSASSGASGDSLQITLSEFKLKIEREYENNIQQKILSLLAQAYGKDHISVSVKSRMDLDKKIQDIVTYTPSTSDGRGVVSHSDEEYEQTVQGASSGGGVAGAQQNTETTTTYPGVTVNGNVITTRDKKTYSYLVSKVEEQIQSDAAALDDLTVSVVITTDGMTNARRQEQTGVIANAAAVDPSKVAVMAVPMAESLPASQAVPTFAQMLPQILRNPAVLIAGGLLLVLAVLLIVFLVARRRRRQADVMSRLEPEGGPMPEEGEGEFQPLAPETEPPQPAEGAAGAESAEGAEGEQPAEEAGEAEEEGAEENVKQPPQEPEEKETIEDIRNAQNSKEDKVRNDLQSFSSKNPEIAAQLIRSWLKGEDDHGHQ